MDQERKCFHCGAPQKWSENKQKWYCSALCWKNKQPEGEQPAQPQYQPREMVSRYQFTKPSPAAAPGGVTLGSLNSSLIDLIAKFADLSKRVGALETLNAGRALELHQALEDSPSIHPKVYCPNCGGKVPAEKWIPARGLCEGCATAIDSVADMPL